MNLFLTSVKIKPKATVSIGGSKSETNRLLLLQALYPQIMIENSSDADDSAVMRAAFQSKEQTVDIRHAGTAMRFLTAYFAIQEGKTTVLTGSPRMKQRPINILVDALRQLGAAISYEGNEGFPPLRINGKKITQNKVTLPADVSSQYISALLLIAPKLENGLELTLKGEITSRPYIEMTLGLLNGIGVETSFEGNTISVNQQPTINNQKCTIESDWSSASYYYCIVALSAIGTQITLANFKRNSLQGDSLLSVIYQDLGVETVFCEDHSIVLKKIQKPKISRLALDLNPTPDLAQTIAVSCFGLGLECQLNGLHTLKIKETDRLSALKTELEKLGAGVCTTHDTLHLKAVAGIRPNIKIATYQDHRMAMAFAPLAVKVPITIGQAEVVSKSYPAFWDDLKEIGFAVKEIK